MSLSYCVYRLKSSFIHTKYPFKMVPDCQALSGGMGMNKYLQKASLLAATS